MPLVLAPSGYCHGLPAVIPTIPGFRVIASKDTWLMARKGGKTYIVRDTPTHWILERFGPDIWGRDAERHRRATHAYALHLRAILKPAIPGSPRKAYKGERLKGKWAIDKTEAIAVRKEGK